MVDPKKPISLMGMMGSGKSTLGRQLALHLGYQFVDLDRKIEESVELSIPDIFKHKGESGFRQLEREVLITTIKNPRSVIALGGGTPCYLNNIDLILSKTFSIYLKVSKGEIQRRISRSKTIRPLAVGKDFAELSDTISAQIEEREKFYNQAELLVESDRTDLSLVIKFLELAAYL